MLLLKYLICLNVYNSYSVNKSIIVFAPFLQFLLHKYEILQHR